MPKPYYGIMRFEVNTDVQKFSDLNHLIYLLLTITFSVFIINISLSLKTISRNFEIDYLCKIILVDKSSSNLNKLYRLTGLKNKQQIRDLCQQFK